MKKKTAPKKAKKKVAKKKVKKAAKKKTTKRAKRNPLTTLPPLYNLHKKKLEIMEAVPIMPCSGVMKDRQGVLFAHTQASKVFFEYSKQCRDKNLVIHMVDCVMSLGQYPQDLHKGDEIRNISCSRAVCTFRITDQDTGQFEEFMGSGLGDNDTWSDTSAQTVAYKQALLLYFFTAWPEPSNTVKMMRDEIRNLDKGLVVKAIKQIMPDKVWDILNDTKAVLELTKFYGG